MYLRRIKTILKGNGATSLNDIMQCLNLDSNMTETLLEHWQDKGKVVTTKRTCGLSCDGCGISNMLYMWRD